MKFIILSLFILQIFGNEIISDYLPATEAHITLQEIQNITKDFDSCVDQIKLNECNLIDQWQSEIEKLKLENENSINIEIPFLKERKAEKQKILQQHIDTGTQYDGVILSLIDQLKAEQQDFVKSSWEIQQLYKLPEDTIIELIQKRKDIDVVHALNANVPRVAENEVRKSKAEYELGDISIQAQTVNEEMLSGYNKLEDVLDNIDECFSLTQTRIQNEKNQIVEDITRIRALIDKENQIQAKNLEKIAELEQKVIVCDTFPKNVFKDCGPLKVNAQKRITEMNILEARTNILFEQIEKIMNENQSLEQIQAQKDAVKAMEEAAAMRLEEEQFVYDEEIMPAYEPPKELKPKHHLQHKLLP